MELTAAKNWLIDWRRRLVAALPSAATPPAADAQDRGFLPNFCTGEVVLNIVIIAEMLAFVVTLITRRISLSILEDLLLISLFTQWVALASIAALCYTRKYLNRLPNARALVMAYLLLLLVTFAVGEAAIWTLWAAGKIATPRPEWHGYFHIQNLSVAAIVNGLALRYLLNRHELKQRTLSEARAKIQALQSRLRPHFVFNTLNIIAALTRGQPAKAEAAIEDMADLFRMMLSEDENLVPVKKEIDVAKKYIALEKLRLDNRLTVDWDIGTFPRKTAIPVLTLQPLLENAIRHGIEALPAGGLVSIKLWEDNDKVHIRIVNPYPSAKSKIQEVSHVQSLENIRQRFRGHYGEAAQLAAVGESGQFSVTVVLPTRGGNQ